MGTYFFYETTSPIGDDEVELTRCYYDDISEEVMTRVYKVSPKQSARPVFQGSERIPLAQATDELKRKVHEFACKRGLPS